MLNIGDTVKIISKTLGIDGEEHEYLPIGSIGRLKEICCEDDGSHYYAIEVNGNTFYYLRDEIEKGHMEWVKDNED